MLDAYSCAWTEVRDWAATGDRLAFLPVGALEEHGPHLPLATDTIVAVHTTRLLAEHFDGLLLPAVPYGETWATSGYPGTVSLSPATVTAVAVDIGRAVGGFGVGGLVIVNGDFGNREPLAAAARTLNAEDTAAMVLNYPGLDEAIAEHRRSVPLVCVMNHAEEVETSMVLAVDPELVHPEHYVTEYPTLPVDFGLRPLRLHEVSASGVFGDPGPASAETGELLYAAVLGASAPIIRRFLQGLGA